MENTQARVNLPLGTGTEKSALALRAGSVQDLSFYISAAEMIDQQAGPKLCAQHGIDGGNVPFAIFGRFIEEFKQ